MKKLGIVQGRLSPPINNKIQAFPLNNWREEFSLCKRLGLGCIEWIFEYDTMQVNPICDENGIKEMLELSSKYNVRINSLLADYFMEKKLFGDNKAEVEKSISTLFFIINQCKKCNIPIIEIPLVDSSALNTEDDKHNLLNNIQEAVEYANKIGIYISLETSLPPEEFRELILSFKPFEVKVNYDMGNSASLDYNPEKEIELLGEFIINVHIKDRIKGGTTVPLGMGDTNFESVFYELKKKEYSGDFILQAARQDLNHNNKKDIVETIENYINYVNPFLVEF